MTPSGTARGPESAASRSPDTETYITSVIWYHPGMERTQISLEPEQADRLRRLAQQRGVSMAHLVREAVDQAYGNVLTPPTRADLWHRAMEAMGSGHGDGANVAEDHDRYLDEAYGS
jgi:hypothetical protein